jgi:hypothetical protein
MLVCRPERRVSDNGGSEQVRLDPANASAMQLARAHECGDLGMNNGRNPENAVVRTQELNPPTTIADQQLAVNEVVAGDFVSLEYTSNSAANGIRFARKRIQMDVSTGTIRLPFWCS